MTMADTIIVQALFNFKGKNNDELCFKKGDKITVTQIEEGGWWEGTLNGLTGWFPSNYVKECKETSICLNTSVSQQHVYQAVVLKDLIDSEKAHVAELQGLVTNFLQPLEKSTILTPDEYKQMTGNLLEVLDTHQQLLKLLEDEEKKPNQEQRVGRLFITWAPKIKGVHQAYCSLHPRAVCILDKYKDEFTKYMESRGAATPGVLVLTTGLSKPFRRLDKYSGMLQELERHIEESHPDRGDTQRSVSVFKEIAATCAATRRQKDLELQVLTGPVRGWEGQSLATLGDIIYMGSVAVGPQHHDRYLVLFPSTLLILSVSHRLSAFIYEGKLPLTGINVARLEDNDLYKNAFEISGPMIEKRVAVCQSKEEAQYWVDLLRKHMPRQSTLSTMSSTSQRLPSQVQEGAPQPPPHMTPLIPSASNSLILSNLNRQGSFISNLSSRLTSTSLPPHGNFNSRGWSPSNLRPAPPVHPRVALGPLSNRRATTYKEDSLILEVIEAYCMAIKPRNNANSVNEPPVRDEYKLKQGYASLRDFQLLQDRIKGLEYSVNTLKSQFMEERNARCLLQDVVKKYIKDVDHIDRPRMET